MILNDARLVFVKSQNYEPSRKMAVNAVALSEPGDMERLGSISAFIFHSTFTGSTVILKKNDEVWGNSKFYLLCSDYI